MVAEKLIKSSENETPHGPTLKLAGQNELRSSVPGDWLSVGSAAELKYPGKDRKSAKSLIQHYCNTEWEPAGLVVRDADGQRRISRDADPAFGQQPRDEEIVPDLRAIAEPQRRRIMDRKIVLQTFKGACRETHGDQKRAYALVAERTGVSEWTVRRWAKRMRREGEKGLIDKRSERPGIRRPDDPYLNAVAELWLNITKPSISACIRMAEGEAQAKGWTIANSTAVRRFIQAIPGAKRILRREGAKAFRDTVEPYIERDYSALRSNEIWVADHHQFDVIVKLGERVDRATGEVVPIYGRPFLTLWLDMRSRMVMGWVVSAECPNSDTIARALAMGCRAFGIPEAGYFDNGKDFSAKALGGLTKQEKRRRVKIDPEKMRGIYAMLGMGQIQAMPYNARAKIVERFFGTMAAQFCKTYKTYCGRNPAEKPEGLAERLHLAPTLEEFTAALSAWITDCYAHQVHHGDGMGCTPAQAWERHLTEKRVAGEDALELMLMPRVGPVKVQRNGVRYKWINYGRGELMEHFGENVFLRIDVNDLRTVRVYTEAGRIIGTAHANERLPAHTSAEDLRAACQQQRRDTRILREAHRARTRVHFDMTDRLLEVGATKAAAAAREAAKKRSPEVPLKIIQPALEGELQQVPLKAAPLPAIKQPTMAEMLAAYGSDDAAKEQRDEAERQQREMNDLFLRRFGYSRPAELIERERREDELWNRVRWQGGAA